MSPGRPLILGVLLWLLCSVLYFACIHVQDDAGLYRVYGQSIEKDLSAHRRVEKISPPLIKTGSVRWVHQFLKGEWGVLQACMFFGIMTAFNIGFRDINFGRWLRLLTRQLEHHTGTSRTAKLGRAVQIPAASKIRPARGKAPPQTSGFSSEVPTTRNNESRGGSGPVRAPPEQQRIPQANIQ